MQRRSGGHRPRRRRGLPGRGRADLRGGNTERISRRSIRSPSPGTPGRPFMIGNGNAAQELLAALEAIQAGAVACSFPMPRGTESDDKVNPTQVDVQLTPPNGPKVTFPQVIDAAQCGPNGGWCSTTPDTPTTITLCPRAACWRHRRSTKSESCWAASPRWTERRFASSEGDGTVSSRETALRWAAPSRSRLFNGGAQARSSWRSANCSATVLVVHRPGRRIDAAGHGEALFAPSLPSTWTVSCLPGARSWRCRRCQSSRSQ